MRVCPRSTARKPAPSRLGNNARTLARYVRDKQIISLEDAIRKMTSLPATTFGFEDRGLLRPGLAADIVVFDPEAIADPATFEAPKQFAVGVDAVLVNGQLVVDAGQPTGGRPERYFAAPAISGPRTRRRADPGIRRIGGAIAGQRSPKTTPARTPRKCSHSSPPVIGKI